MRRIQQGFFVLLLLAFSAITASADGVSEAMTQGNTFFTLGQYEMAIFQYRLALAEAGTVQAAQAHHNIGACYYQLGQMENAAREFREALRFTDSYPKAAYALGLALEALNDWPAARQAFAQAVQQSNGQQAEALFELGLLSARDGNYERAITEFRQALKHGAHLSPSIHNNIGIMLALTGHATDALQQFTLAYQKSNRKLAEADHNLKLCRRLLAENSPRLMAELKMTGRTQSTD
ncbi:MAG: tetratricopeptide repeat protein [Blastocatellia bacterium]